MLDYDTNHIKLIDFGCAITYDINNKAGSIEIIGTTTYAGSKLLELLSCTQFRRCVYQLYEYERTFDFQCALNILISTTDDDIKHNVHSIEILLDVHKKQSKLLRLCQDTLNG
jgi:hypothetical protein